MPRGRKRKLTTCDKCHQSRGVTRTVRGAPATAVKEKGPPSCLALPLGASPQSCLAARGRRGRKRAPAATTAAAAASCSRDAGETKDQDEGGPPSSEAAQPAERSQRDPAACRVGMLLRYLLHKYNMKKPITKRELMKITGRKYKEHFPEILRRVTEHMELIFGLDLKEIQSIRPSYILTSKLEITKEKLMIGGKGFPKNGILLPLLGMIYTSGSRLPEEEMWEFLKGLGIHDGRRHVIFGDPRKLITEDLVQEKYLEYQLVPNSDPPCYEFLWGPRAQGEASKTKILEFLVKINNTDPGAFQALCEDILDDEEDIAAGRKWARAIPNVITRAQSRVLSSSSPSPSEV